MPNRELFVLVNQYLHLPMEPRKGMEWVWEKTNYLLYQHFLLYNKYLWLLLYIIMHQHRQKCPLLQGGKLEYLCDWV